MEPGSVPHLAPYRRTAGAGLAGPLSYRARAILPRFADVKPRAKRSASRRRIGEELLWHGTKAGRTQPPLPDAALEIRAPSLQGPPNSLRHPDLPGGVTIDRHVDG